MTIAQQQQRYRIPECLKNWPWPRRLNPYYLEVKPASAAWTRSFNAFSPEAQDAFDRGDVNLLASLAYPHHDAARLRTCCDLMNQFFIYDEYSDVCDTPKEVQEMSDIIVDALRNPHKPRPAGEWVGGELTRQFWELAIQTATPTAQARFLRTYEEYTDSVVLQAADRQNKHVRTVDEYFAVRRHTVAAKPSFAMIELALDIPQHVMDDAVIRELETLCIDMILLGNDILSYNLEQARGDDLHSIVTTVMYHHNATVQEAMDWVEARHLKLEKHFLELYRHHIPKYCSYHLDVAVTKYVDGLGAWIRASDQWSFEGERYFGKRGPEIREGRWVTLMPKQRAETIGPQMVDGSLL